MIKAITAELCGTFWLTLVVFVLSSYAGTPGFVSLYVPAGIAIAYGLLSLLTSQLSGGQLNPAVTIGWVIIKRMRLPIAGAYIVAQLVGAAIALLLFRYLSGSTPLALHGADLRASVTEMLGSALFVWALVTAGLTGAGANLPGFVAAGALFIALSFAQAFSGGLLNPAIALAGGSFGVAYLVAPLVGGVVGALAARFLSASAPTPQ